MPAASRRFAGPAPALNPSGCSNSLDGEQSFDPIVTDLGPSVQSYDWAVPASLIPAGSASVEAVRRGDRIGVTGRIEQDKHRTPEGWRARESRQR